MSAWWLGLKGRLAALGRFDLVRRWQDQRRPESLAFDAENGTDTARFDWGNYEPTLPQVIDRVLDAIERCLGPEETAKATFVDLGCGKGRVILKATERSFGRVIGVELDAGLVEVAKQNIAAWQTRHPDKNKPTLVHGDAATVPLQGEPLILYMYNPFPTATLDLVLRQHRGQGTWVAYVHPVDRVWVEAHGFRAKMAGLEDPNWLLYRGSDRRFTGPTPKD